MRLAADSRYLSPVLQRRVHASVYTIDATEDTPYSFSTRSLYQRGERQRARERARAAVCALAWYQFFPFVYAISLSDKDPGPDPLAPRLGLSLLCVARRAHLCFMFGLSSVPRLRIEASGGRATPATVSGIVYKSCLLAQADPLTDHTSPITSAHAQRFAVGRSSGPAAQESSQVAMMSGAELLLLQLTA